jgi:uncharacterized membrane protein
MTDACSTEKGKPTSDVILLGACCAAVATLLPVAAYQVGALDHLPDPPLSVFASDRITQSKAAHPLGMPDGILGLGSYAITLALVMLARTQPKARRLVALKLLGDGSMAGFNLVRQLVIFRKMCSWCTGTALCTFAMVISARKLIAEELGVAD